MRKQVVAAYGTDALNQLSCVQSETAYDITLSGINSWFEANSVEPHVSFVSVAVADLTFARCHSFAGHLRVLRLILL